MINETVQWNGLEFETDDADVYSPKPASIFFADVATKLIHPGERVLDMCTGSGIVGIAVGKFVRDTSVVLSDINEAALSSAKRNAARNGVVVKLVPSNLYDHFADNEFDAITVHPPAVPYPDGADWGLSPGMRVATHGGDDGSELVVRSIAEARRCLQDGGRLLLLLPHWSNVQRAWDELRKHYTQVTELSRKQVEFFPVREGKPDQELIQHVMKLAGEGVIEMSFASEIPQSWVSVVEGLVKKIDSDLAQS
jgi:methylase of polypeptide subunit release factors